jgi:hypothetical protein
MNKFLCALITITIGTATAAEPVLVGIIGSSYENSSPPINDAGESPFFYGMAVNSGRFNDLGQNLSAWGIDYVINEAESGATTFSRPGCSATECTTAVWSSFDTQYSRLKARTFNPAVGKADVDYLYMGLSNDCLHSDAFGLPQNDAVTCTNSDRDLVVAEYVRLAEQAVLDGMTPVYSTLPEYDSLNLPALEALGIVWTVDKWRYSVLRYQLYNALTMVPGTVVLCDTYDNIQVGWDGIHPTQQSMNLAGKRVARAILNHKSGKVPAQCVISLF